MILAAEGILIGAPLELRAPASVPLRTTVSCPHSSHTAMFRSTLHALALLLLSLTSFASPQGGDPDLGAEIDRGLRWLRERQAPDGSYGEGVKGTAWALQAFGMSHRKYTRSDGPFVARGLDFLAANQRDSGAIHDLGATEFERSEQSILAWLALSQFDDAQSNALRTKLGSYFPAPLSADKAPAMSEAEAREGYVRWLAKRKADGSWGGADGAVIETARAIIGLTQCRKALNKKSATPETSTKLPAFKEADRQQTTDSLLRGALFLIASSEDGLWGAPGAPDLGLTAMALGALQELPSPRPERVQRVIDAGLAWLVEHQQEDGSIHDGKLKNYLTSASVLALSKAQDPDLLPVIKRASEYLIALQADEGEGYSDGDLYYGGIGYGGDERPDLSNLQMALEALNAAGVESTDASFQRALKFLDRVQNRSESNDTRVTRDGKVIHSGDDGGAGYAPGESKAGLETLADGTQVPRSYGSMTYALLKGFIFAGLSKDDPRMQAAWEWVREHYTLDVNPGFEHSEDPTAPYQGLLYYFHTMARALDLYGEELVVDGEGREHPWRAQLCGRLVAMQRKDDGSWVNENAPRWWEGNPVLATSYALLTLGAAMPKPTEGER
jgi:squalene-hopene/tetraprenyl-beta-curcumene cyclase